VRAADATARAARDAGVERFLHVSSGGVYGDGHTAAPHRETDTPNPGNAYERSKLAGEIAVQSALDGSSVRLVILRPAGIYGPSREATRAFFDEVRHRRLWLHSSPNVIVHPTYVSDVVQASIKTLRLDRWTEPVINVAGERPLRFQDFVDLSARALCTRARHLIIPAWIGRPLASTTARALRIARAPVPEAIERMRRAYINRSLDTTLAKRMLGFEPVDLESAIRLTVEATAAQPHRRDSSAS
jgi:nucleoside-diphosphate-sugar epimerase